MNIPEILVANGTGAVLVSFLLLLRVRGESKNSVGTELFCRILVVTLLAQATETISFLLDGVPGAASRFWLYLMNTVCTGAAVSVGFAWCLYVDFRVYRSTGRLRRRHLFLGAPLLAVLALLTANLFGTGWIFTISADNVYHRGPLNSLLYLLLFGYYAESVWQVHKAKRDGVTVEFFSVRWARCCRVRSTVWPSAGCRWPSPLCLWTVSSAVCAAISTSCPACLAAST